MLICLEQMTKRKASTFRIDERLLEAIAVAARKHNTSKNHYIESLFIKHCQELNLISQDFEPLGETRGGDRTEQSKD
jgi:hypothetical protein